MTKLIEDLFFRKKKPFTTGGCLSLSRCYIRVYDHYFQTTFLETAWPIKAKPFVEDSWKEGT